MFKIGVSSCLRKLCSRNTLKALTESSNRNLLFYVIPTQVNNIHLEKLQNARFKSRVSSKIPRRLSESGTESEKETKDLLDDIADKHIKTVKVNVLSMRMDAILKAGLGISRNKIETMFYESKVRLNGEKVPKKSVGLREGDEIDIIKGVNISNPDFLTIARIEVRAVEAKEESISVKMRICKSLTVENYPGRNAWEA